MFIICASVCVEFGMQLLSSMNNVRMGSLSEISITTHDRNNPIGQRYKNSANSKDEKKNKSLPLQRYGHLPQHG
jgi:hypothetical protein